MIEIEITKLAPYPPRSPNKRGIESVWQSQAPTAGLSSLPFDALFVQNAVLPSHVVSLSVCLSVCPSHSRSVTLDGSRTGRKSLKVIQRINSAIHLYTIDTNRYKSFKVFDTNTFN